MLREGHIRAGYKKPPRHSEMDDPLCRDRILALPIAASCLGALWAELHHDVFSGAVNRMNAPLRQLSGLEGSLRLEGLSVRTEPRVYNPIALHPRIYAARNRLNFRQFRHISRF